MKRRFVIRYVGLGALEWPDELGIGLVSIHWSLESYMQARADKSPGEHLLDEEPMQRKFGAVKKLFTGRPAIPDDFSVLLADDDLLPRGCTVADVFDAFERSGARIAHPGLTRDSQCSHAHLFVEEPARLAVPIDFTELQAPLFTRAALIENLAEFDETVSCWGLERLWAKREREAGRDVVRLDTVPFFHGREQTGGLRSGIAAGEHYGMGEAREFCRRHNCETLPPLVRR